jgi:hypothetical protein
MILIYDVETQKLANEVENGFDNPAAMGFGSAAVYSYEHDRYLFFMQHEREALEEILTGNTVVSFNGKRFDNKIVVNNSTATAFPWVDIDLLEIVIASKFGVTTIDEAVAANGSRKVFDGTLNLRAICGGTFGKWKSGKGIVAPELIKAGRWSELFAYNLHGVRLTRELFEYILQYGTCKDKNGNAIEIADNPLLTEDLIDQIL